MSFYRFNKATGEIDRAETVYAPEYTLTESSLDQLALPIDGWHWFSSDEEAKVLTARAAAAPIVAEAALHLEQAAEVLSTPLTGSTIAQLRVNTAAILASASDKISAAASALLKL